MTRQKFYHLSFDEIRDALIAHRDNLSVLDKKALLQGTSIENWPPGATFFVDGTRPTDYLFYPLAPWFTVSNRVQSALETMGIRAIQFLPVRVEHRSGISIPGYVVVNILEVIAALSFEHTEWLTPEREKVPHPELNIWKAVLEMRKIQGYDIFRLGEVRTQVFVSEKVKICLEQKKAIVGFNFIPVSAV